MLQPWKNLKKLINWLAFSFGHPHDGLLSRHASTMQLNQLLVNFHRSTLLSGLGRTYPNSLRHQWESKWQLMSFESLKRFCYCWHPHTSRIRLMPSSWFSFDVIPADMFALLTLSAAFTSFLRPVLALVAQPLPWWCRCSTGLKLRCLKAWGCR